MAERLAKWPVNTGPFLQVVKEPNYGVPEEPAVPPSYRTKGPGPCGLPGGVGAASGPHQSSGVDHPSSPILGKCSGTPVLAATLPSWSVVGSPRGIAPPGHPQIRTCGFPASGSSENGLRHGPVGTVHHAGRRQGVAVQEVPEPLPGQPSALGAAAQSFLPGPPRLEMDSCQRLRIAGDPILVAVTPQLLP